MSGWLKSKAEFLAEHVTIARETAPAFQSHCSLDPAGQENILPHRMRLAEELNGLKELHRELLIGHKSGLQPGRITLELKARRRAR
jgi:hypothetical protein